jgi:hypothetical protein
MTDVLTYNSHALALEIKYIQAGARAQREVADVQVVLPERRRGGNGIGGTHILAAWNARTSSPVAKGGH